jgi:hypothetical protein
MNETFDIPALIRKAHADPKMRARAAAECAEPLVDALASEHLAKGPGASDAGSCSTFLWAREHESGDPKKPTYLTLPEAWNSQIVMEQGTFFGAWYASLAARALTNEGYTCYVELEGTYEGLRTHPDLLVFKDLGPDPLLVVEFKSTNGTAEQEEPGTIVRGNVEKLSWLQQVGMYALEKKAEQFAIVVVQPALQNRKDKDTGEKRNPPKMRQFVFDTAKWASEADREARRIRASAEVTVMPASDLKPSESWRCATCAYADCQYRLEQNPLQNVVDF